MPWLIINKDWEFESSLDNITEELAWVKKQIKRELSDLQKNVQESQIKETFFEKKENTVIYHMDLVKQYLQSCVQKDEFQINSAVVMAVQIALESKWYEVWKIDWLLKNTKWTLSMTEQAIRKFQKENWLRIDWVPWRNTVKKILEKLWNVPVEAKKPEKKEDKKENPKWKDDLDNTIKSLDLKQEDLIKILALEIYRWRIMTDKEIEAKGYDSKEVQKWVKNTSEMEKLDRIIPKNIRHEQVAEFLEAHNSNEETKWDSIDTEPKEPEKKPVEKPTENKEDNNEEKNIKPIIDKSGEVKNLEDILRAKNLVLPKLKANDVSEIGWLWNSMMFGFQWHWKNNDKHFTQMLWAEGASTTTHIMKFKSEGHVKQYAEKNPHIKSFVLYFGWNTSNNEQTLNDLKNRAEWLSKAWIEPVLCTCIGVDSHISKDEKYSGIGGRRLEPLNDSIRWLVNESNWKYKLIDFDKVDDVIEMWSNKHPKSYALMHDIIYRCIEK